MKLKQFIVEVDSLPKKNPHEVLHKKLKELFSAIEIYEKSDYSKRNEFNKLDTFKDFIKHFTRDMERKSERVV